MAEFATTASGHDELLAWLEGFGPVARVGMEGTSSYGAGLARSLRRSGIEVVEVDRPNRQSRRRTGKSDPADAIEAARAALSGRAQGAGKSKDGNVEAIRALVVAKRSARDTKIKTMNQIRHLGFTAPDELRERLEGVSRRTLAATAAALRPRRQADQVGFATRTALSMLGRRVLALDAEKEHLDSLLAGLVEKTAPELLGLFGVGIGTAATLLVTAGDNPERIRSEAAWAHLCGVAPIPASSGKVTRCEARPRRRPPSQFRLVGHRDRPHVGRQSHPCLRRAAPGRGAHQARDHQDPEALRGPAGLPLPASALKPPTAAGLAP